MPLFVEELTKAVLESEQLHETGDRYVLDQPAQPLAIPTTLQASLMARVDRLGSAREVLQIGAAIGREFSYEVLAAVAGLPDAVLQDALIRLTEAELVFLRGTPPNAVYIFKHALVQDTAYSTMLRARRQQLHSAIALVLEKRLPEIVKTTPGSDRAAIRARPGRAKRPSNIGVQAGERDLRRFAMKESIAHYSNALRLVTGHAGIASSATGWNSSVCLGLGLAQQIAIGPTAKEARPSYGGRLALSRALPDRGRERFLATWGVWFHATMSGADREALRLADELVAIARELDDSDLLLEAYHARGADAAAGAGFRGDQGSGARRSSGSMTASAIAITPIISAATIPACARRAFTRLSLWGLGLFRPGATHGAAMHRRARALGPHFFARAWPEHGRPDHAAAQRRGGLPGRRGRALSARRAQQISLAAGRCAISPRLADGAGRRFEKPASSR